MQKEFKKDMAEMFSLMERMGKHMTAEESEYNRQSYLKEALGNSFDPNVSNKLQPQVDLDVIVDHTPKQQKKELQVLIKGLSSQSIGKVRSSQLGYNKDIACTVQGNQGKIELSKSLPYYEPNKRKKDNTEPNAENSVITTANNNAQQDEFNLDDELADILKESDDFDIESMLNDIMGDNGNDGTDDPSKPDATQGYLQTPETLKKSDEDVWKWLNTVYKGVIDIATNGGKDSVYTPDSISNLYDIDGLFTYYMSKKHDETEGRIYNELSDSEINEEIRRALKSGDFSAFTTNGLITPLDIDAVIWGNQLSSRNVAKILKQANMYGFTPTMLHGATIWSRDYNRKVVPGARPFHVSGNMAGNIPGKKNGGSQEHFKQFGQGYKPGPVTMYDVADTQIIDPQKGDPYQDNPGIQNNLTGAKNQAAIDYIQKVKSQIPQELLEKAEATNTDGGKAKIYNEVLSAYCQQNVQGLQLTPIDENADDNTAISIYTRNVYALAEAITKQFNYANPQNAYRVADALAFCIAYYTTGADKLQVSGKSHGTNVQSTWKEEADSLVSNVKIICNFIRREIKSAFTPLREKINELLKAENKLIQIEDEEGEEESAMAQKAAPAASNTLNEGVNLDCLLNDIRNFKL